MTREEFIKHCKAIGGEEPQIEDCEFNLINEVYVWHPAISENPLKGKAQIAKLYVEIGFGVIAEMHANIERYKALEEEAATRRNRIRREKNALESVEQELNAVRKQWNI